MPGVLDSNLDCGVSREVGKMAFFMNPDLLHFDPDDVTDLEEIADKFLNAPSSFDTGDSEGELPDEPTVDLVKFLDPETRDFDVSVSDIQRSLLCDAECIKCSKNAPTSKGKVSARDPFMGSVNLNRSASESNYGPCGGWSILGQIMNPLDDSHNQSSQQDTFSAWGHTSNSDEYQVFTKTSLPGLYQEDETEDTFPDTPSTYSDPALTDDSDVDIETVDGPRSADLYPTPIHSSSPLSSPCKSPSAMQNLQRGSLMSILGRSSSTPSTSTAASTSTSSAKSILRFNSQGVSSSVSLAENLMLGRAHSISGQKRKLQKERKRAAKAAAAASTSTASHQAAYPHILVSSNSVNFHDYAMSPGSCVTSTETGRPTVMAKRLYKKRQFAQLDISDKEKQHHHNQLERNRRQKLADLFTYVRDEIPRLKSHSKASKVVILNDATDYIRELNRLDLHQEKEIEALQQKQMLLKDQLRRLQNQCSLLL